MAFQHFVEGVDGTNEAIQIVYGVTLEGNANEDRLLVAQLAAVEHGGVFVDVALSL